MPDPLLLGHSICSRSPFSPHHCLIIIWLNCAFVMLIHDVFACLLADSRGIDVGKVRAASTFGAWSGCKNLIMAISLIAICYEYLSVNTLNT